MSTLKIDFKDDDTTLLRLSAMATEMGIDAETLAKRALAGFLGDHGLKEVSADFRPTDLRALFKGRGLLKPQE